MRQAGTGATGFKGKLKGIGKIGGVASCWYFWWCRRSNWFYNWRFAGGVTGAASSWWCYWFTTRNGKSQQISTEIEYSAALGTTKKSFKLLL